MIRKIGLLLLLIFLVGCTVESDPWVFTGSIEADEIDLSSEVSGKIEQIIVIEGERVEEGDVLMQLDTEDYLLKLAILENAMAMAELNYEDLNDGNSVNQIRSQAAGVAQIEAQIEGSQKELTYLRKTFEDTEALYNQGASSKDSLDQAKRMLDREEAKMASLISQRDAYKAQLDYVREGATDEAVKSAQLLVEQKELEIEDLKRTIAKSTLTAPAAGYIQNVNYQKGEWVTQGRMVITLIDTSQLWLKIYVPEKYLNGVSLGESVTFLDSFLEGKEIQGEVSYISSEAEFTPKNIESKENKQEMVFETRIRVDDPTDTVKPGMFLDIRLEGE